MTANQLHILRHSLGLDEKGHGKMYRNGFATGPLCDGYKDIKELVRLGFMQRGRVSYPNHYYHVTQAGKEMAVAGVTYPKRTRAQQRYQRFLDADSGMKFIEWIKAYGNIDRRETYR